MDEKEKERNERKNSLTWIVVLKHNQITLASILSHSYLILYDLSQAKLSNKHLESLLHAYEYELWMRRSLQSQQNEEI